MFPLLAECSKLSTKHSLSIHPRSLVLSQPIEGKAEASQKVSLPALDKTPTSNTLFHTIETSVVNQVIMESENNRTV